MFSFNLPTVFESTPIIILSIKSTKHTYLFGLVVINEYPMFRMVRDLEISIPDLAHRNSPLFSKVMVK